MRSLGAVGVGIVIGIVGFIVGAFLVTGAFSWDSTDVDEIALEYTGGPLDGRSFEQIVSPGTSGTFYGPFDKLVKLPANQRTYTVSKNASESDTGRADFIGAANSEGVEVEYETSTYFELNRDPDILREFYERVCTKYDDCYDRDGDDTDGWAMMLNDNLRKAQETTLQNVSRNYSTDDLRLEDGLLDLQRDVSKVMQDNVNNNLGGPYFTVRSFQINDTDVPTGVAEGYAQVKAEELRTQAQSEQVNQANQQAESAEKLREAASDEGYLQYKLIQVFEECVNTPGCKLPAVIGETGTGTNVNVQP